MQGFLMTGLMLTTISNSPSPARRGFLLQRKLVEAPRVFGRLGVFTMAMGLSAIVSATTLPSSFSVFEDHRRTILKSATPVVLDPYVFVPVAVPTSSLKAASEREADERYRVSQSLVSALRRHATRVCRDNNGELSNSLPININSVRFQIAYQKRSKDQRVYVYSTERQSLERMLLRRCVFRDD
jgi:hypothetical protein